MDWRRLLLVLAVVSACFYAESQAKNPNPDEDITTTDNPGNGMLVVTEKEETFGEFEGRLKRGMNSLIRKILPYLMNGASGSKVSGPCISSLMKIIGGVRQLREWSLRFVDAAGKIPPGVLEGTSLSLGDYDQCLDIKVGKRENPPVSEADVVFKGKYCLIEIQRPKVLTNAIKEFQDGNVDAPIAKTKTVLNMFVRYKHLTNTTMKFGVCIPSTCLKADLQDILNTDGMKSLGSLDVVYCEDGKRDDMTTEQYVILVLLGIFGVILLFATVFDVYRRIMSNASETCNKKTNEENTSSWAAILKSFSLYTNALELLDTTRVHEPLRSLCAVRVIVVLLTIYSHTYGHIHDLHFQKFSKPANFLKFFDSFTFSGIANGSVGMDTIFFIAGITISYSRWRFASGKDKIRLKPFTLLIQRYFRMSAAQLIVIAIFLLFPLIGSGPLWRAYMHEPILNCQDRWWLNILYIGNFWSSKVVCLYHTWVLAVIMQLTVLSIFLMYLLRWSPKFGIALAVILTLLGVIGVAAMTIFHDLPGGLAFYMLDIRTGPFTWRRIYTLAYDHFGPFCIGVMTGYYLGVKKDTLDISRKVSAFIWCVSICCSSAVLFGLYEYRNGAKIELSLATLYAVTHRNIWALGIAWLVIACATNHAGAVKTVMESRVFLPLDRLCYFTFLVHIPIMYYHSGSIRERWFMGHFELLFFSVGYMVLSTFLAFVLYISFAKPYYFFENFVASFFQTFTTSTTTATSKLTSPALPNSTSVNLTSPSRSEKNFDEEGGCVNIAYSKTTLDI